MERNDCCIANVNGRNWRSLLLAHEVSDEIRLWVVRRRSQTRRTNTNEQDTYITVCKVLNTKNTETQTDKITHVINHIRTCRKQISAKLRTADIFAFIAFVLNFLQAIELFTNFIKDSTALNHSLFLTRSESCLYDQVIERQCSLTSQMLNVQSFITCGL